jgi:hypothetical protein
MRRFEFHLSIAPEDYLDYYRGTAKQVLTRSLQGFVISFPAGLLVPFVEHNGIHGDFVLICDDHHKKSRLQRRSAT